MRGIPIVVSGPSGVGKGTIIERVLKRDPQLALSISMTTRPSRPGEVEGVHYFFVTRKHFEASITQGKLVEWAQVYSHYYGTPKAFLESHFSAGRNVILDIDVQGAAAVRCEYRDRILIFLLPPSWEELQRRLFSRAKGEGDDLEHRIEQARNEMRFAGMFDYCIINDDADRAAEDLYAVIRVGRLRRGEMGEGLQIRRE